jgi:hypothetical protein
MEFLTNFALQWKQSDDKQTLHTIDESPSQQTEKALHTVPFHVKIFTVPLQKCMCPSALRDEMML